MNCKNNRYSNYMYVKNNKKYLLVLQRKTPVHLLILYTNIANLGTPPFVYDSHISPQVSNAMAESEKALELSDPDIVWPLGGSVWNDSLEMIFPYPPVIKHTLWLCQNSY